MAIDEWKDDYVAVKINFEITNAVSRGKNLDQASIKILKPEVFKAVNSKLVMNSSSKTSFKQEVPR